MDTQEKNQLLEQFKKTKTFKCFYSTLLQFDESLNCFVATEKWRNEEAELLTSAWWMFEEMQVAKAQVVREWIDLNERMPEQGQKVLIFRPKAHEKPHEDPNFKIATYCGNDIWINSHFEHQITHWMPLTNPLELNP